METGRTTMPPDTCAKCGGKGIQRYGIAHAALFESRLALRPAAWLMAYTCTACGFVELYAEGWGKLITPEP